MERSRHDKAVQHCVYKEWMSLQEQELSQLLQLSLNLNNKKDDSSNATPTPTPSDDDDAVEMTKLLDGIAQHFQEYVDRRRYLAGHDVYAFFSPSWCTAFENSISWIAGCRPSSFFSLIYALCGSDIDSKLSKLFQDDTGNGFPRLSATQLTSIDKLQRRTILEEEKLSTQVASLQQEMADMPLALLARKSGPKYELNVEVKDAIGKTEQAMVSVMGEADQLRLNTYKELINILTPVQALEYITSAKKLRLCFQAWGREKDEEHGREHGLANVN